MLSTASAETGMGASVEVSGPPTKIVHASDVSINVLKKIWYAYLVSFILLIRSFKV
jgi:hypothetical protein